MPLLTELGLSPGEIMLDEDPALPPKKGHSPTFRPMSIVAKRLDVSRCRLAERYGVVPGDTVNNTTNPIVFVAILPTFQTMSSNRHFALLSSPDFHDVIVLHGSHALHHFTYSAKLLDPVKVSINHLASSVLPRLLHNTILISSG